MWERFKSAALLEREDVFEAFASALDAKFKSTTATTDKLECVQIMAVDGFLIFAEDLVELNEPGICDVNVEYEKGCDYDGGDNDGGLAELWCEPSNKYVDPWHKYSESAKYYKAK